MAYALITGAAKGIGKGIAKALAKRGYHLLLADIDEERLLQTQEELEQVYHVPVHILPLDLTGDGALDRLWYWTTAYHKDLSVVVNNAGYGLNGSFNELNIDDQLNIVDLNIKAQLKIAYQYIPVLKQFPKSFLLNLGSTTSYQSVPYLNVYAASKAFVLSFTRGLRHELRKSVISVSCLSPGSTDTDFVIRAGMSERTKKIAERFNMQPADVGEIAVNGLFRGKAEIIPGWLNKLNAWLSKFVPKKLTEKIAGNIYQHTNEKDGFAIKNAQVILE